MKMKKRPFSLSICRAFTLIELMVVIGLIAVLAGGVGIAMKDNNPGSALKAAQSTLVSMLSSARGQAALNQCDAMIVVQSSHDQGDNFLRSVKIVIESTPGTWVEVGSEVLLPQGIYVVPPVYPFADVSFPAEYAGAAGRLSGFVQTAPIQLNGVNYVTSLHFTSLGGITGTSNRMLVAAGKPTSATTVTLDNTGAVRGFTVSNYGVATLINDTSTLNN